MARSESWSRAQLILEIRRQTGLSLDKTTFEAWERRGCPWDKKKRLRRWRARRETGKPGGAVEIRYQCETCRRIVREMVAARKRVTSGKYSTVAQAVELYGENGLTRAVCYGLSRGWKFRGKEVVWEMGIEADQDGRRIRLVRVVRNTTLRKIATTLKQENRLAAALEETFVDGTTVTKAEYGFNGSTIRHGTGGGAIVRQRLRRASDGQRVVHFSVDGLKQIAERKALARLGDDRLTVEELAKELACGVTQVWKYRKAGLLDDEQGHGLRLDSRGYLRRRILFASGSAARLKKKLGEKKPSDGRDSKGHFLKGSNGKPVAPTTADAVAPPIETPDSKGRGGRPPDQNWAMFLKWFDQQKRGTPALKPAQAVKLYAASFNGRWCPTAAAVRNMLNQRRRRKPKARTNS